LKVKSEPFVSLIIWRSFLDVICLQLHNTSLVIFCRFLRESEWTSYQKPKLSPSQTPSFCSYSFSSCSIISQSLRLWLLGDAFPFDSFKKRSFWVEFERVSMSFSSSTMRTVVSKIIGVVLVMVLLLAILISTSSFLSGLSLDFYLSWWIKVIIYLFIVEVVGFGFNNLLFLSSLFCFCYKIQDTWSISSSVFIPLIIIIFYSVLLFF